MCFVALFTLSVQSRLEDERHYVVCDLVSYV